MCGTRKRWILAAAAAIVPAAQTQQRCDTVCARHATRQTFLPSNHQEFDSPAYKNSPPTLCGDFGVGVACVRQRIFFLDITFY
jgi:hypothetical protein